MKLVELSPVEESGTRQYLLEPLALSEHGNGMLSPSEQVRLSNVVAVVDSTQKEGAPGSVIHLRLRYHLLPFLVCAAPSKLLNFFLSSLISHRRVATPASHGRGRARQDYIVWEMLHGATLSPYGLWNESIPFVLKVRGLTLASYSRFHPSNSRV